MNFNNRIAHALLCFYRNIFDILEKWSKWIEEDNELHNRIGFSKICYLFQIRCAPNTNECQICSNVGKWLYSHDICFYRVFLISTC